MPAVVLVPTDLDPFAANIPSGRAAALIEGVLARATVLAPCIAEADFAYASAAKSILVQVAARWHTAGTGAITAETQGPYSVQRAPVRELFWPSEIAELQALCRASSTRSATPVPQFAMPPADGEIDPARRRSWYAPRVVEP